MEWLNYHHLYYFWVVAKEGSISKARQTLNLSQPTVSAQIRALEDSLGERLFKREGRRLILTDTGQVAFRYAEDIFELGHELMDVLRGRPTTGTPELIVGIADVLPKLIVYKLLEPALKLKDSVKLICREDRPEKLLADLGASGVSLILSDSPVSPATKVKAYNHLLGECGVSFLGSKALAEKYRSNFPQSLYGAPLLMPTEGTALRRELDQWFAGRDIRPHIIAELDDSALIESFGSSGIGLLVVPQVIEEKVCEQYGIEIVGRSEEIRQSFYVISVERKLKHPAVIAICEGARHELFQIQPSFTSNGAPNVGVG